MDKKPKGTAKAVPFSYRFVQSGGYSGCAYSGYSSIPPAVSTAARAKPAALASSAARS